MKLNDSLRFPHPVLDRKTGDYTGGEVQLSLEVSEYAEAGQLHVSGTFDVTHSGIRGLVESGELLSTLLVCCLDTYYVAQHPIHLGDFKIELPSGHFRGAVTFRAMLSVKAPEVRLPRENVHPEFDLSQLIVRSGDVVGLGDEFQYEAGLDKLAPLESVFQLVKNPELAEPRFELAADGQAVQIAVSPKLYDQIATLRSGPGRNILLSALYLPCVIELLSIAHSDPKPELRWFQAIEARCRKLNIPLDGKELATRAQQLLSDPLGLLYAAAEGIH